MKVSEMSEPGVDISEPRDEGVCGGEVKHVKEPQWRYQNSQNLNEGTGHDLKTQEVPAW